MLLAEVPDQLSAELDAHDRLWADAVIVAEEAAAKANAQIRAQCVELGIPARHAPQLELGWRARSPGYADQNRRVELHKLAETRLAALTKIAKTAIQAAALETETQLLLGGLESSEARQFLAAMPTVEQLMPPLSLDDLGVTRWQPPEDAAAQLTTPMSATDRRRRQIRRAIQANPHASDREIAEIVGCADKTIASYRRLTLAVSGRRV